MEIATILDKAMRPEQVRGQDKFSVRVSHLTKLTAAEYVQRHFNPEEGFNTFYSYRGNGFSEAALRPVTPYRELHVEVPIPGTDVMLTGHPDAIIARDDQYAVVEFKTHEEATAEKIEAARRQGILYLAMAEVMRAAGNNFLEPAPWAPEDTKRFFFGNIPLHETTVPAGVHVTIATWTDRRHAWFGSPDLEGTLTFYLAKAQAIVKSIQTNDLRPVLDWDEANPLEFHRTLDTMMDPTHPLSILLPQYDEAKRAADEWKSKSEALRAEVIASLKTEGLNEAKAAGYKVSVSSVKGRESLSKELLVAAGIDLAPYTTIGPPTQRVNLKKVEE